MSAGSVAAARPAFQRARGGAIPTPALQDLLVRPVPPSAAKPIFVQRHYLHSFPGGTRLTFGVFVADRLLGALALGVGPAQAHCLVAGAQRDECLTLTRLWLEDALPSNSESRVLGVVLRMLRRHTAIQFVLSYAAASEGHIGTIYQATGWLYTGTSKATPLYALADGKPRHSRSFAHAYGTRSQKYFQRHEVDVRLIEQQPKHRYLYPLDSSVPSRLTCPVLPYPKKEASA